MIIFFEKDPFITNLDGSMKNPNFGNITGVYIYLF